MATSDFGPLLVAGISKIYDIVGGTYEPIGPRLFASRTSSKSYEQVQGMIGYGLPQPRNWGTPIASGALSTDFGKQYLHTYYGLSDVLPKEAIANDVYGLLTRWCSGQASSMAESFDTLQEWVAYGTLGILGFGAAPVAGAWDAQPLCSTVHPISAINPTFTWGNRPAVEMNLSNAALQWARWNLETQRKANNLTFKKNKISKLVFNPSQLEIALQLTEGKYLPHSGDWDLNTIPRLGINLVSWPYWVRSGATGTFNGWLAIGEENTLEWYEREPVRFDQQFILAVNSILFAAFCAFTCGWSDPRGVAGSVGI